MKSYGQYSLNDEVNGYRIIGVPLRRNSHIYYPVECLACGYRVNKYSVHLRSGEYGCSRCYHNKQRLEEYLRGPSAVMRYYKTHCKSVNRNFNLTVEEVCSIIESDCHYCGRVPSNTLTSVNLMDTDYRYNGMDRVDSSLDYDADNVVPCCWDCNRMKGKMSSEDFLAHCQRIVKFNQ